MISVTEELCLLVFDDVEQQFLKLEQPIFDVLIACGTLFDLILLNRIECVEYNIDVLDLKPLDNPMLDPVLALFNEEDHRRDSSFWIKQIAHHAEDIRDAVLQQLVEKQIMQENDDGVQSLSRWVRDTRKYPHDIAEDYPEVKTRILELLLSDADACDRGYRYRGDSEFSARV